MKKWMIGILAGVVAIGLGVGGAFLFNHLNPLTTANLAVDDFGPYGTFGRQNRINPNNNEPFYGRMGRSGAWMNPQTQTNNSQERISTDDAVSKAEAYLANYSQNLQVAEVMEFQSNFYVLVKESDSGRGAMELLVDPNSGYVTPEIGPNMMWNLKYGRMAQRMGLSTSTDNTLSLSEALTKAQTALSQQYPTATINEDGISFYGYYTFDYSIDGQVAGMLSVNGLDGQVWLHTWHGEFISEKEIN